MSTEEHFYSVRDPGSGIHRQLAKGLDARIFAGDRAMLSIVRVQPHAEGAIHSHPEEQWGVLLEGDGIRTQDGVEVPVKAGDFWRTPGGVSHGFKAGAAGALILDIFSPPREEYRTGGSGLT